MADPSETIQSRERALFLQVLDIDSPEERTRFLQEHCPEDQGMRERIQKLIAKAGDLQETWLDPAKYPDLADELDRLTKEIADESDFVAELGDSIRQLGDYELIEEIGRGATGVVYRAKQASLNREVAVKVILGSALASPTDRQRFRMEVESAATLRHPNAVEIYEVGRHNNHDFYSMALMRGGTLRKIIDGKLPQREAAKLMLTLVRTIEAAHSRGIIHCDLKPDNILLDEAGVPHISDFGLAYRPDQQYTLTMTSGIMGSPQYMSPEQADPQSLEITTATDVYSLGAIFYEILTGQAPFKHGSLLQLLVMVKEQSPKPLRSISSKTDRDLETIVLKCLHKNPYHRYESASKLAEDIEAWLGHRPIKARPATLIETCEKWIRRKPTQALLIAVIAFFMLLLGIGGPLVAIHQAGLREEAEASRESADIALGVAEEQRQNAEAQRALAERDREAALEAKAEADRVAQENRSLAYTYGTRLAQAAAVIDPKSFASRGIYQILIPEKGDPDIRGWEWYFGFSESFVKHRFLSGSGSVGQVSYSPQGNLVACSYDGTNGSLLRDGLFGAVIHELKDDSGIHVRYAWAKDGSRIITLSETGVVKFWDTKQGRELVSIPARTPIISIAMLGGADRLVTLSEDQKIQVWELTDTESVVSIAEHRVDVIGLQELSVSPNGRYLAGFDGGKDIYLWSFDQLTESPRILKGHLDTVLELKWHRDSRWLLTRAKDGEVRLWETLGGSRQMNLEPDPNAKEVKATSIAWDPNGFRFLVGMSNGYVYRFDLLRSSMAVISTLPAEVNDISWSNQSHAAVFGLHNGDIHFLPLNLPRPHQTFYEHDHRMTDVQWNVDGSLIACQDDQGGMVIVNPADKEGQEHRFAVPSGPVTASVWSPVQPDVIAVCSKQGSDTAVQILSPDKRKRIDVDRLIGVGVLSSTWSQKGSSLAALTNQGTIIIWELDGLQASKPRTLDAKQSFTQLSYSPDGQWLVATGNEDLIGIWDSETGKPAHLGTSPGSPYPVAHAWHPSNNILATVNSDNSISVWGLKSRTRESHFETDANIPPISWHPDGKRLLSAGKKGMPTIWDWKTGEIIYEMRKYRQSFQDFSWSPDGIRLAATNKNNKLVIFDATAGYLMSSQSLSTQINEK